MHFIFIIIKDEGWSKQAVAGLLGNIQKESLLDPGAWQSMGSSGSGNINQGYGLVQWTSAESKFLMSITLQIKMQIIWLRMILKN